MPLKLRPWLSQVRAMPDALDRTGAVMAVINLIKKNVDAAPIGEKDSYRWDTELKGFGLKVTPAGRRIYIYQYRTGGRGSPTKRVTLGVHGEITCDKARDDAKRHAGAVTSCGSEGR